MIAFIEAQRAGLFQRQHTLAALHEDVRVLIIRLGRVLFIDATAMNPWKK